MVTNQVGSGNLSRGCATPQASGAKAAQIVVPSSAVLCASTLMLIRSPYEQAGVLVGTASGGAVARPSSNFAKRSQIIGLSASSKIRGGRGAA
jgi:hypothetical protein